jgi:hypothetical protein
MLGIFAKFESIKLKIQLIVGDLRGWVYFVGIIDAPWYFMEIRMGENVTDSLGRRQFNLI